MSNGIVLNHHSLPFVSQVDANSGLLVFLKVLKNCRSAGLKILLVDDGLDKSLMRLELATGYFVSNWFAVAKNDALLADWRRLLQSLETKQPLFEAVDLEQIDNSVEVGLLGEQIGINVLLAAFHFNSFLSSFSALDKWCCPHVTVWVRTLAEELEEKTDSLLNLFDEDSLEIHGEELKRRRNDLICSARDIWVKRGEFFPHLSLLSNQIGTSLQYWSARQEILLKARDSLNIFELFCTKWKNGEYADYRHEYLRDLGLAAEVSGESASVSNDSRKKKERMFWLDDGREVYCENHVKLPDSYRLHFYPDASEKRIYVAYLGPHMTL